MTEALLRETPSDGVALLTINRPDVMNAIDMALAKTLGDTLDELAADDDVRAIVLTGAGERAFSAGFDIQEMTDFDAGQMMAAFVQRDPLFWKIANHPKPLIFALNGITYGAGALMAFGGDIRIGTPKTAFKVTASNYGAANATWTLPNIVGLPKAKEILLTGRAVPADEALSIGLLNHLVEEGGAKDAALTIAAMIAANPPAGAQGVKQLVNGSIGRTYEDGWRAEFAWMMASFVRGGTSGAAVFDKFNRRKDAKG